MIKLNGRISMVGTSRKFIKIPVQWHSCAKRHTIPSIYNIDPSLLSIYMLQRVQIEIVAILRFHGQVSFRTQYHARFDLTLLHDFPLISIYVCDTGYRISYFLLRNIDMKINLERDVLSLCINISLFIYIININYLKLSPCKFFCRKKLIQNLSKSSSWKFFLPDNTLFFLFKCKTRVSRQPRAG